MATSRNFTDSEVLEQIDQALTETLGEPFKPRTPNWPRTMRHLRLRANAAGADAQRATQVALHYTKHPFCLEHGLVTVRAHNLTRRRFEAQMHFISEEYGVDRRLPIH